MQTPLWVTITGFVVGPAALAAFLTYIFSRKLNTQKAGLEEAMQTELNTQKADLEKAMQSELNTQKAGLEEAMQTRLNKQTAELQFESGVRANLVDYVKKQRYGLYRSYILVFEEGPQASPGELLELLRKADSEVIEPLREFAWGQRLQSETKDLVYDVHNFLRQAIPYSGEAPSSQTIEKLWKKKGLFAKLRAKAINALDQELGTLKQD